MNEQTNDGRPRIVADKNIGGDIVDYLEKRGFSVLHIANTKAHSDSDVDIATHAARYGAMIVTHDRKDFTNFGYIKLEDSPGILVLPQRRWKKALDHFFDRMVQAVDLWHGKVAEYRADDILAVHTLPFRPSALKEPLPTVICYNYAT